MTYVEGEAVGLVPVAVAKPAEKSQALKFKRTTTATIMATSFPPIRWVVPDYVAEGLSLLAGRQKLGG